MYKTARNILIPLRVNGNMITNRMNSSFKKYDLVVYGATGFTGQHVVEEVAKVAEIETSKGQPTLKWAIAGRNEDKLTTSLNNARSQTGLLLDNVGIIVADISNKKSLNEMASMSRVVVNCVGPYQLYGEPVVQACIENGSDHVDISGEPQFLEEIQLKYNKSAKEAGLHIVGACGYDSIPAEMGIQFMESNFPGKINSVDLYSRVRSKGGNTAINIGTLESAVLSMAEKDKIFKIRKQLFTTKLPKPKFRNEKRGAIHHNKLVNLWGVAFPLDEPVVLRTQRYKYETLGKHPIQFKGYIAAKRKLAAQSVLFGMGYIALLASNRWTRSVLLKYPEIMTRGAFKSTGGDRDALRNMTFTSTLVGKGWENVALQSSDHPAAPDKDIVVEVSGPDPGYAATSLMLVSCAMTLLREKSSCTEKGGVLTPGVAFMNTNILERLQERGMKFKVVKDPTIPSKL